MNFVGADEAKRDVVLRVVESGEVRKSFNVAVAIPRRIREVVQRVLTVSLRSYAEGVLHDTDGFGEYSFSDEIREELCTDRYSKDVLRGALLNLGSGRISRGAYGCYDVYSYFGEIVAVNIVDSYRNLFDGFGDRLDNRSFYVLSELSKEDLDGYETIDYFSDYVLSVYKECLDSCTEGEISTIKQTEITEEGNNCRGLYMSRVLVA